jgi:protein gp37
LALRSIKPGTPDRANTEAHKRKQEIAVAASSAIEWTDATFNPWIGCTKVGPGCDHCYAERDFDHRYGKVRWGPGEDRHRTSRGNWQKPIQWNRDHTAFFAEHGRKRRVFCASLADVFDNEVDPQWRADLFDLIAETPNLEWLLLTKRIGNVARMCGGSGPMLEVLSERVWLGATIVNQAEAERDIPKLLATPARIRFLSMEPLLGAVTLEPYLARPPELASDAPFPGGIDWVIVGGESGPNARALHPDWVRGIRDQCLRSKTPFLFKQWGEWAPAAANNGPGDDLMSRPGRKAAGRLLDGRTWSEFPEAG